MVGRQSLKGDSVWILLMGLGGLLMGCGILGIVAVIALKILVLK